MCAGHGLGMLAVTDSIGFGGVFPYMGLANPPHALTFRACVVP
ncbi:hypothetical protein ACVIHI_001069 [Bradyrhizobium sp. USDA 4524]|nr:hypothetical protein [Bradyrhizobium sp. USDA 4538]MCP1906576.1 hypothetical protein [Bradyrhizobium sp. USDA 4537]MCP1987768.1 hypothetical protein [Bradyrhizobium sp. USDA 4539]